jgi:hypothetical protein
MEPGAEHAADKRRLSCTFQKRLAGIIGLLRGNIAADRSPGIQRRSGGGI